jgi:hypothetical protein
VTVVLRSDPTQGYPQRQIADVRIWMLKYVRQAVGVRGWMTDQANDSLAVAPYAPKEKRAGSEAEIVSAVISV